MKIGIIFDTYRKGGGGYNQSIVTAKILNSLSSKEINFEFISMLPGGERELVKNSYKVINFTKQKSSRLYYILSKSKIFESFFNKFRIENPFTKFLFNRKYDLVFFLGPSFYINCCNKINFMVNIYDLNFKFNNFFPEYKNEKVFNDTKDIINKSVDRAFKIFVDTDRTKEELNSYFLCPSEKITVYPFSSHLPGIWEEIKENFDINFYLAKLKIPENLNFFYYPAQFWAHKNHRYIIDALKILKKKKNNYKIIFSGSDKGNLNYIKKIINDNGLNENFLIYDFLEDKEVISIYLKSKGLIMPTFVARSTLPLYEAFYFKKPVFYSKGVLDPEIEKFVNTIDLEEPMDLACKIESFNNNEMEINNKVNNAKNFYNKNLKLEVKSKILQSALSNYNYVRNRWN
jgi:glycosyltransferase involved in cell wall biosynthesis